MSARTARALMLACIAWLIPHAVLRRDWWAVAFMGAICVIGVIAEWLDRRQAR
jgi:hypothetical protein